MDEESKMFTIPKLYMMPLYGDEGHNDFRGMVAMTRRLTDTESKEINRRVDAYKYRHDEWNYDGIIRIIAAYAMELGIYVDISDIIDIDPEYAFLMDN